MQESRNEGKADWEHNTIREGGKQTFKRDRSRSREMPLRGVINTLSKGGMGGGQHLIDKKKVPKGGAICEHYQHEDKEKYDTIHLHG